MPQWVTPIFVKKALSIQKEIGPLIFQSASLTFLVTEAYDGIVWNTFTTTILFTEEQI